MVQGHVGVASGNGVNVHEVVRLDAQLLVQIAGRGGGDRVHRRVHGAGEDVNLVILDVGEGGEQTLSLGLLGRPAPGQKPRHGSERNYLWRPTLPSRFLSAMCPMPTNSSRVLSEHVHYKVC